MSGCPLTVTQSRITLSSDGNLGLRKQRCRRERRDGQIRMDKQKVKAIEEWGVPVTELRSVLGLLNSSGKCQRAFEDLKRAVTEEPVLRLPDYTVPFEVHTEASDYAIGRVLVQEGHPVAYESRKLNETERRGPSPRERDNSRGALPEDVEALRAWIGSRRELEQERKKKELADETVRRDEMIKSASRLATRIKNAVERKKELELFLRIAESKASRLTEVFHSLVSQLRE
ncbi:Retrovirus-related Pol polyprotein from transposon 17.6, partial [Mucuna pruriens]